MDTRLFKAAKAFMMKKSFDFTRPDIGLHSFHSQMRLFIAPMGIFFNNENSLLRFIWPFLSVSLTLIANVLEMLFVLHGLQVEDYSFATECFCYFILLGVIPLVYGSSIYHRENLMQILDNMDKDFKFICKLESKYRDHFLKGQLLIWQLCFTWITFTVVIGIMYGLMTVGPLLYLCLFATQDEHTIRPLIFPMWLPEDDPYRTPNYEIFFFLQFHVLLHNYYLLELAIMHLEVIFVGLDESVAYLLPTDPRRMATQRTLNGRMKTIVKWHNSVFKSVAMISKVQGAPLVYQVLFSSMAVCLMMYQIAEKFNNGTFDILFVMLFVATTAQLWIPCYLGTMLRNKGFEVGDACWDCGWHETALGRLLRMDIIIVILRAQQPLSIQFTGLPSLSLETFSAKMSSVYSYFNMLRQYK